MIGGALRRIVTFKSKQQFLPSNAPYVLLYFIFIGGALRRIVTFKLKQQFLPSNAPYVLLNRWLGVADCNTIQAWGLNYISH
ncbi:MAG: hypothetical protein RLZZ143_292 [Cyanobacteriota bacterium]|jgi:hypothetical protein|uniref:hypothetical protein n=1 Tax=Microcystis TaxID=1125 RepID=UPI000E3A718E|nr:MULTISPECIES: hypothetical protein [Microcystis]MBD2290202.1 hypothetical protein [Microcystis wesenbergii FACHB-1317]REJ57309.1 MAG: hypothetical protein DWQ58_05060 [Microcystis aeruginosa TA09]UZO74861.1 hypothetical protein M8120_18650 [Microcystis aeruginosa str. Chao 1910]